MDVGSPFLVATRISSSDHSFFLGLSNIVYCTPNPYSKLEVVTWTYSASCRHAHSTGVCRTWNISQYNCKYVLHGAGRFSGASSSYSFPTRTIAIYQSCCTYPVSITYLLSRQYSQPWPNSITVPWSHPLSLPDFTDPQLDPLPTPYIPPRPVFISYALLL